MGRRSETGGVKPAGDRIEVRFTYQGKEIRPTLKLKPSAANLAHARRLRATIVQEIAHGTFDLKVHFPDYRYLVKHEPEAGDAKTFGEWCDAWTRLMARSLEHSTLSIYKRHLAAYWRGSWASLPPQRITHTMVLERLADLAADTLDTATGKVRKGLGRKTQNNIMIPLRGVFELICKSLKIPDPTDGVENLKVQKAEPDPFTIDEVEAILADLQKHDGAAWADYFEFSCFAGLRCSEHIAVEWSDMDLRTSILRVSRSFVMGQEKDRTKTHVQRFVELNIRAAAVIQRQRARTQTQGGRIFLNPSTGRAFAGEQEQLRVWRRCLRRCGIRYRPPKECRDTSVTMALQSGAGPYWVAAQHGHSVTTMLRDYAKWIPQADRGRNLAAVNSALGKPAHADSAVEPQLDSAEKEKSR